MHEDIEFLKVRMSDIESKFLDAKNVKIVTDVVTL